MAKLLQTNLPSPSSYKPSVVSRLSSSGLFCPISNGALRWMQLPLLSLHRSYLWFCSIRWVARATGDKWYRLSLQESIHKRPSLKQGPTHWGSSIRLWNTMDCAMQALPICHHGTWVWPQACLHCILAWNSKHHVSWPCLCLVQRKQWRANAAVVGHHAVSLCGSFLEPIAVSDCISRHKLDLKHIHASFHPAIQAKQRRYMWSCASYHQRWMMGFGDQHLTNHCRALILRNELKYYIAVSWLFDTCWLWLYCALTSQLADVTTASGSFCPSYESRTEPSDCIFCYRNFAYTCSIKTSLNDLSQLAI